LPDLNLSSSENGDSKEGVSYVYVGAHHLARNYRAEATFTLPRSKQARGFYGNGIRLGPMKEDYATVQLMLVRYARFHFAQHVAIAWSYPFGSVYFKDTDLVYRDDDSPHRLAMAVREGTLALYVDGSLICTTSSAHFVRDSAAKYFQIRTETNVAGFTAGGTVRDVVLKRDTDPVASPFTSHCEFHGWGIGWLPEGGGLFRSSGAFYPNEATYFEGIPPGAKCGGIAR
jgi:hypothetical protein